MDIQNIIDALWEKVLDDLVGIIAIWSGAIVDIPTGWHLCDGDAGTIDLRDLFVRGAGGGSAVGSTGGADTHTHDFTIAPHDHNIDGGTNIAAGADYTDETDSVQLTGTTDSESSLPRFYALAYIQKI